MPSIVGVMTSGSLRFGESWKARTPAGASISGPNGESVLLESTETDVMTEPPGWAESRRERTRSRAGAAATKPRATRTRHQAKHDECSMRFRPTSTKTHGG